MEDSSANRGNIGDSGVVKITGKIMVVAIILLFFIIAFVFCLHLYAKWFWYRHQETTTTTTRRRRRLDFAAGHQEITLVPGLRPGLDPSILKAIPVLIYDPEEFKDGLECAVCLCEVSKGEKTRILPKCNHGFHLDCIDMWFGSHSTCPLCRNLVVNITQSNESTLESILQAPTGENVESPNFPSNVLFWGNEVRVSTFGSCLDEGNRENAIGESSSSSSSSTSMSNGPDRTLVIDVPRRINEDEEQKSPVPTRLRSLKRLLSGSRRVNPSSPRNLDLEEGGRGES